MKRKKAHSGPEHPRDYHTFQTSSILPGRVVRWNNEFLYLDNSAVGYTSVPFALGATGPVFHTNLELAF
jgi:hypothetical protein